LQTLRVGLTDFSASLARRGVRLAVLNGLPFAREANCHPASAVPQWFSPFGGPCLMPGRTESLRRRQPLNDLLMDLENQGTLQVVDLFDLSAAMNAGHERCPRNRSLQVNLGKTVSGALAGSALARNRWIRSQQP
jgi:hypothetical protein